MLDRYSQNLKNPFIKNLEKFCFAENHSNEVNRLFYRRFRFFKRVIKISPYRLLALHNFRLKNKTEKVNLFPYD